MILIHAFHEIRVMKLKEKFSFLITQRAESLSPLTPQNFIYTVENEKKKHERTEPRYMM
jgi:hypothetical protein